LLGTITIKDLKITCITGIHPKERELPQNLYLDIELDSEFAEAEKTEEIESTIDYEVLANFMKSWVQEQKFKLLETLAERACLLIFKRWKTVKRCKIKIKKPGAIPHARYAGVSVDRERAV